MPLTLTSPSRQNTAASIASPSVDPYRHKYGERIDRDEFHRYFLRAKMNAPAGSTLTTMRIDELYDLATERQVRQRDWSPFVRHLQRGELMPARAEAEEHLPPAFPTPPPFGGAATRAAAAMSAASPSDDGSGVGVGDDGRGVGDDGRGVGDDGRGVGVGGEVTDQGVSEFDGAIQAALSMLPSLPPATTPEADPRPQRYLFPGTTPETDEPAGTAGAASSSSDPAAGCSQEDDYDGTDAKLGSSSCCAGSASADVLAPVGLPLAMEPVVGRPVEMTSMALQAAPPPLPMPLAWLFRVLHAFCMPVEPSPPSAQWYNLPDQTPRPP